MGPNLTQGGERPESPRSVVEPQRCDLPLIDHLIQKRQIGQPIG